MHTEDLAGNSGGDGETVKGVDEGLPDLDVASTFALIVESVNTCDIGAFMVASQQKEILGELQFVAEQQ